MNEATDTHTYRKRSTGARIALLASAAVAGLMAAGALALGGLALWGHSERDADGYLSTSSERFEAGTRALATENLDLDMDGADWLMDAGDLGRIRLDVEPENGEPVFVGIARTDDVDDYLRGVAHSKVTHVDYGPLDGPFEASYSSHDGKRRAAAPAEQPIWAASTSGAGAQKLTWDVEDGHWSIVVMNADGSPGVAADISAGAKVSFLDELGWTLVGGGAVLLLLAGALAYRSGGRGANWTPWSRSPGDSASTVPSTS